VTAALEDLLEREINIAPGLRSQASDSQNHLRGFLRGEATRDMTFPSLLRQSDSDFLGGSFARRTKNWPLDDIDVYLPLEGSNLLYINNGARMPYTLRSDSPGTLNPMLTARWMAGIWVSSSKMLSEFAAVLRRHYPAETIVRSNGTSVTVRMSHGQGDSADGLGYDVVPCFSLVPDNPQELEFYLMPDGFGGWMRTNPKLDTDICQVLQQFHCGLYRKIVKLTKYWNQDVLAGVFPSYYIELALSRAFLTRRWSNQPIGSLSEGLALALTALHQAYAVGPQRSWIAEAPPVKCPSLALPQRIAFELAEQNASLICERERSGMGASALERLQLIFGESL
jgi:hypothetical protein